MRSYIATDAEAVGVYVRTAEDIIWTDPETEANNDDEVDNDDADVKYLQSTDCLIRLHCCDASLTLTHSTPLSRRLAYRWACMLPATGSSGSVGR